MKRYLNKPFYMVAGLLAFVVIGAAQAMGFHTVDMATQLDLNVEWIKGFTSHADGIALIATAALAATEEAIQKAQEKLRTAVESATEAVREKLQKNLNEQIMTLDTRIAEGEKAAQGVAELKETHAKMSQDNAKFVEQIETMVKSHADSLNEEIAAIKSEKVKELGLVNPGAILAKAVKESGLNFAKKGQSLYVPLDGPMPSARQKDVSAASATVYQPGYVPGIIGPGERALRVRDLMPTNRTSQNTVYFVSETALTDNAAPQSALGAAKGETTFQVNADSETIKTIAHFIQVPIQMLDDIPGLESYINSRMLFLLDQEEEDQILYGNDTGQNLNGLITQATTFDTTLATEMSVASQTDIDKIRLALAQVQNANYPPSGIIINNYNWAAIELLKDSQYRYLFTNPASQTVPRLWGLPVVATSAMTSPDFLVGAFNMAAAIWDKQEATLAISTEDSDNFQKNLATIRAEKRMTLTVYRTASIVQGDFAATIT